MKSEASCGETTALIVEKLRALGFRIHEEKSQFLPKKVVKFLGFMIDSKEMQAYLPSDKVEKVESVCKLLLKESVASIQVVSSAVGLLNSYAKAVDYGDNHIKKLEINKVRALQSSKGNFDVKMEVSRKGKQDLSWWYENAKLGVRDLRIKSPVTTLITDASNLGWGGSERRQKITRQMVRRGTKFPHK